MSKINFKDNEKNLQGKILVRIASVGQVCENPFLNFVLLIEDLFVCLLLYKVEVSYSFFSSMHHSCLRDLETRIGSLFEFISKFDLRVSFA